MLYFDLSVNIEMSTVQEGITETTGDGYQIIDLEQLQSGASEPQLPSAPYDPASLSFVSLGSAEDGEPVSGSVQPESTSSGAGSQGRQGRSRSKVGGRASQFLDSKGFGWLMEVEDDGEEEERPLLEELDIDVKDIYYKLRCVLLPLPFLGLQRSVIRDSPDFWGPLFVVLAYALISVYGQFRVVSWIITIWIFGSLLVFFLARVLGGEVSYSQTLGVIGYCLLPLVIVAPLISALYVVPWIAFAVKGIGVLWATYSAGSLLAQDELRHKKPLLLYPTFLVYVYLFSLYTGA